MHRSAVRLAPGVAALWAAAWAATAQDSPATFAKHMHEHLGRITDIKTSVIAGKLEDTREPAKWLAEHDAAPGLPGDWEPYVERMRRYARYVERADTVAAAATSVSEMARVCGECHLSSGATVAFGYDQKPEVERKSVSANMLRHLWAADRMWEGLIGPSDFAWQLGTGILAEVSLDATQLETNLAAESVGDMLSGVRSLGARGKAAATLQQRSALYGDFLSRCADCHALTGGGPAP